MNSEAYESEVSSLEALEKEVQFSNMNLGGTSLASRHTNGVPTPSLVRTSHKQLLSSFGNMTNGANILRSLFQQVALHLQKSSRKRLFSRKYYERRASMIIINDIIHDSDSPRATVCVRAIDDINVVPTHTRQNDGKKVRRREKKMLSMLSKDAVNLVVAECLANQSIRGFIQCKKTLEFFDLVQEKNHNPKNLKNKLNLQAEKLDLNKTSSKNTTKVSTSLANIKSGDNFLPSTECVNIRTMKNLFVKDETKPIFARIGVNIQPTNSRENTHKSSKPKANPKSLEEARQRLSSYDAIMQFLCAYLSLDELSQKLTFCMNQQQSSTPQDCSLALILGRGEFIKRLVRQVVEFEEIEVFRLLIENVQDWDLMFSEIIIELFTGETGVSYLLAMLKEFNTSQAKQNSASKKPLRPLTFESDSSPVLSVQEIGNKLLTSNKLRSIIRTLMEAEDSEQSNSVIIDFLKNLNTSNKEIARLVLDMQEETRVMNILAKHSYLVKEIEVKDIVASKMFALLALIDSLELINVLNMNTSVDGSSSVPIYQVLCEQIKQGSSIEGVCNLIMSVNQTYWDFDKLWKLYLAVSELVRYEKDITWLASISNPLLFFMKLAHFFIKTSKSLDLDSKDIANLVDEIIDFCKLYIENTSEETLLLQLMDKDNHELTFYEYAFMVRGMSILEIDFVANVILQMWDLSRKSKQSFLDFFKLAILPKETKKFSIKVFRKKYHMPVEDSDMFQLEYFLTSRSAYLSVLSEILWTILLAIVEFYFSLLISSIYVERGEEYIDSSFGWLIELYESNTSFFIIFAWLRISGIVNWIVKSLIIEKNNEVGRQLDMFFKILLCLYGWQMIFYPLIFGHTFMITNLLQMCVTLTVIGYTLFLGLSLDNLGVLLRIFARMVVVVIVFAIVSIIVVTCIAYPAHTFFLEFTQEIAGQDVPELNMFRTMYNGVLTLFEFIFGAVVFVRPYREENFYTYATSFFMVIFSFFGNIMLANMLIAFLASQFASIEQQANYYTLRMQFGLTKVLKGNDLDSAYSMPFILSIPCIPAYFMMIKRGPLRKKLNRFLRKVIFVVNIFTPCFIAYSIYLVLLMVKQFLSMYTRIIGEIGKSTYKTPLYLILWSIIGPLFLIKLGCDDIWLVISTLLNFRDTTEDDLFQISISAEDRSRFLTAFRKIYAVGSSLEKRGVETVGLGSFIYDIGKMYPETFYPQKDLITSLGKKQAEEDIDFEQIQMNKNNYLFKNKYSSESIKMYAALLKKYVNLDDRLGSSARPQSEIDVKFLLERFKGSMNSQNVHLLVAIDKLNLEKAKQAFNRSTELGLDAELGEINGRIDDITKDMTVVIKHVLRMSSKMFMSPIKPLPDLMTPKSTKSGYKIRVHE